MDLNNAMITTNDEDISNKAVESLKVLPKGTVLVAMYGGFNQIGRTGMLTYPATINQAISALLPTREIDSYFLITELNYRVDGWKRIAASSRKDPNITKNDVESFILFYPHIDEQKKMSDFFCTLDAAITLCQRKLDGLRELKKGYLQQMFPQAEQREPRMRFAGFSGEWQKQRLGDVVERVTRKNTNLESTLPLTISAQFGLIDQNEFFDKQIASKDVSSYFLLKKGEFAYNKSYSNGHPWGAVKRLDRYAMGVLSTLYIVFAPTDIDSEFLLQYYETDRWHEEVAVRAAEGTRNHGLLNITPSDFFDTELLLPATKEEQERIGVFFQNMEESIMTQFEGLELLKKLKAAYLQKMFV